MIPEVSREGMYSQHVFLHFQMFPWVCFPFLVKVFRIRLGSNLIHWTLIQKLVLEFFSWWRLNILEWIETVLRLVHEVCGMWSTSFPAKMWWLVNEVHGQHKCCASLSVFFRNVALTLVAQACGCGWLHSTHQFTKSNLWTAKYGPQILPAVVLVHCC